MTIYVPIVPSRINGFECIPIKTYDNGSDVFASQTSGENKIQFFYEPSPLNQDSDYTHIAIRFLSLDSNTNPIVGKYSSGVYIAAKQSTSSQNFIEMPAHLFIQPANTVAVNNIRVDPSDGIPKIVTSVSPLAYRNITYQDYNIVENSGINKYYRSQIKLLNLTANNSFSYTSSQWRVTTKASTSVAAGSAIITVSTSSGIIAGLNVTGNGIALGATVASVSGTTITLSANSTQTTTSNVVFHIGQTFLNQDIGTNVSDWSYQTIMKPVFISNLLGFDSNGNEYIGITDFKSRNTSSLALFTASNTVSLEFFPFYFQYPQNEDEILVEYKFSLYDSLKNEIDSSGLQQTQKFLNQTNLNWTNSIALVNNDFYYLEIYFKTDSGFEYTKRYRFTAQHAFTTLSLTFNVTNDRENGRVEFEFTGVDTSSESILLLRSSLEDGYDNFNPIALFQTENMITTSSTKKYFYDYFIEPGMLYKYKFQSVNSNSLGEIISRGVTFASGAIEFNGTNDFILSNNFINSYPFTLETWVNLDTLNTDKSIFYISDTQSTDRFFGLKYSNSQNRFVIEASNTISYQTAGSTIPTIDTWYHLAGVFSSPTDRKIYINGILNGTGTQSVAFNSSSTNRTLMGLFRTQSPNFYLDGTLSDARIWNVARTADQISQNLNKRLVGDEANLIDYYKLDSTSSVSVYFSGVPTSSLFPSSTLFPTIANPVPLVVVSDATSNANSGTSSGVTLVSGGPFNTEIEVIPDFTGSFLCGKDDIQINFIHNGQISGFNQIKKDSIIETIGGKFPFVVRNSALGYKQFQFNALITYVSDPTRSLRGLTYTELINKNDKDSTDNFSLSSNATNNRANIRYEDFLLQGPEIYSTDVSYYLTQSDNGKNYVGQQRYMNRNDNYIIEKQFRKKIIEWLNDGNPKIFKSDTEGLFLVRVSNVSFDPVVELGRTLYTFSCTLTEIGDLTYENLVKYGLRKPKYRPNDLYFISNINNFTTAWTSNTMLPQGQYFYIQDTSSQYRYYKVVTTGTTGNSTPSISQTTIDAIYTSSSGSYVYSFVGYSIPGKY